MGFTETEIITSVTAVQRDSAVPQMTNTPKFLVIYARTATGLLNVRISETAFEELVGALGKFWQAPGSQ